MSDLDANWAKAWMMNSAKAVAAARIELIELDRAIGDGDHGENMDRGFSVLTERLETTEPTSIAEVLKLGATTLMSTVGGAAGPLYGTALLRASKVAGDQLDGNGVADLLAAALEGVQARGKAEEGEKTMVDALAPAVAAAREAAGRGESASEVLALAAEAAADGAEATIPMVATKGRASYLGERSAGHLDPGARSTAILLAEAADAAKAEAS